MACFHAYDTRKPLQCSNINKPNDNQTNVFSFQACALVVLIYFYQATARSIETAQNGVSRIRRDVRNHPCYKNGSFKISKTGRYSIECMENTSLGCDAAIPIHGYAKCRPIISVYPDETLVQDCACDV